MIAPTRTLSLFGGPATLDAVREKPATEPTPNRNRAPKRETPIDLFAGFASSQQGYDPITDQTAIVFEEDAP